MFIVRRTDLSSWLLLCMCVTFASLNRQLRVPNIWGNPQRPAVHTWLLALSSKNSHGVNFCKELICGFKSSCVAAIPDQENIPLGTIASWQKDEETHSFLSFIPKARQTLGSSPTRYSEFQNLWLDYTAGFSISVVLMNLTIWDQVK